MTYTEAHVGLGRPREAQGGPGRHPGQPIWHAILHRIIYVAIHFTRGWKSEIYSEMKTSPKQYWVKSMANITFNLFNTQRENWAVREGEANLTERCSFSLASTVASPPVCQVTPDSDSDIQPPCDSTQWAKYGGQGGIALRACPSVHPDMVATMLKKF